MPHHVCFPTAPITRRFTRQWPYSSILVVFALFSACQTSVSFFVSQASAIEQAVEPGNVVPETYSVFYSVDELPVFHNADSSRSSKNYDATILVALLKSSVAPESWKRPDTDVRVSPSIPILIIRQTKANHQQIANWLERLKEFSHFDSQQRLLDALTDVGQTNRRVLLMVGRPELQDVQLAFEVYQTPSLRSTTDHFVLQCVCPEQQFDWTEPHLSAAKTAPQGLTVLSSDGKVIKQLPFTDRDLTPARIKAFLRETEVPLMTVKTVLENAMKLAQPDSSQPDGKRIWLVLSEPGCVHCIRLQQVLDAYKPLLGRDYVIASIDTRMVDADQQTQRLGRTENDIPWYAMLNQSGKPLATSESPTGNIGFPTEPPELDHFRSMLMQSRLSLTNEQVNQIHQALGGKGDPPARP